MHKELAYACISKNKDFMRDILLHWVRYRGMRYNPAYSEFIRNIFTNIVFGNTEFIDHIKNIYNSGSTQEKKSITSQITWFAKNNYDNTIVVKEFFRVNKIIKYKKPVNDQTTIGD
jgi:hypothetical protein